MGRLAACFVAVNLSVKDTRLTSNAHFDELETDDPQHGRGGEENH